MQNLIWYLTLCLFFAVLDQNPPFGPCGGPRGPKLTQIWLFWIKHVVPTRRHGHLGPCTVYNCHTAVARGTVNSSCLSYEANNPIMGLVLSPLICFLQSFYQKRWVLAGGYAIYGEESSPHSNLAFTTMQWIQVESRNQMSSFLQKKRATKSPLK